MENRSTSGIAVSLAVLALIALGGVVYFFATKKTPPPAPLPVTTIEPTHQVIGRSVDGRSIDAYTYGTGTTSVLFVGGIHGGYEWNSVLLAYTFMEYVHNHPSIIPKNISVIVIPSANPDGVYAVIGKEGRFTLADVPTGTDQTVGRLNANTVDLNRNFDCKWQEKGTWQSKTVSAGSAPFSEPEAQAIRDFVTTLKPAGTVFWHSKSNAVYASQCKQGILPETLVMMNTYATAAEYPAVKTFTAYPTTGAADDWMASIGSPAITVELSTHETIEWEKNIAGIGALLNYFGQKAL